MENLSAYLVPAVLALFLAWRWFRFRMVRKALPKYLARDAQIVDVRSTAEFAAAHTPGSLNIPLGSLSSGLGRLNREKPVLLCCASGARSGMAVAVLKKAGFKEVLNAGPWQNILASQMNRSET